MSLKQILEENSKLSLDTFQRFQGEYDRRFVSDTFSGFDKVRHTYAHMGNLFGRLAQYVQMVEDGHHDFSPDELKTKVIPDLLVYSAWLANELGVNIEEAYLRRTLENIKRLHQSKISSKELQELELFLFERFKK